MGCLYRSPALKAQGIYLCERGSGKIVNVTGGRGGPQGKSIFQHSKTDRCTETVIAMDLPNLKPEWDTSGHRVPSLVKELLALDCCSEQKGLFSSVKLPLVYPPHSRAGSRPRSSWLTQTGLQGVLVFEWRGSTVCFSLFLKRGEQWLSVRRWGMI